MAEHATLNSDAATTITRWPGAIDMLLEFLPNGPGTESQYPISYTHTGQTDGYTRTFLLYLLIEASDDTLAGILRLVWRSQGSPRRF